MKILGIIPSRFGSTRFPGKALVDIQGTSMIQRVYRQTQKTSLLSKVVVATDHQKIFDHVKNFGGNVTMTNPNHPSGTDRCLEALYQEKESYDFVINIQGDEPLIDPQQIDTLAGHLEESTEVATLAKKIQQQDELFNPNVVKVVFDQNHRALYFSRSTIPFIQGHPQKTWLESHPYYKHLGIYAYRSDLLQKYSELEISQLEKSESLEQLRWLDSGYSIKIVETHLETIGVDTPEDLEKIKVLLAKG